MAHFIGYVKGNRSEASRLGTVKSGVRASANGWSIGGTVRIWEMNGEDMVSFTLTSGSGHGEDLCLGTYKRDGRNFIKL